MMRGRGVSRGAAPALPQGAIGEGEGMARKKDQAARRQQLVSATIELIAERGIEALTLGRDRRPGRRLAPPRGLLLP